MDSKRRRQSAEVYRRRRIFVGILAVLLMALGGLLTFLVLGWFSADDQSEPGSDSAPASVSGSADEGASDSEAEEGDPTSPDSGGPDSEDSGNDSPGSPESEEAAPEDGSCRSGDLLVRAETGSESYAPGFAPMLVMEVENTADYACTADLGTAEQEFVVAHAGATVFSTAECSLSRENLEVELEPGQVERANFTWPRSDSSEDCSQPDSSLGPGSYELTVSLRGVRSEPQEFILSEG
ncbi:hypothetical protein ACHABX_00480 [Nesterenkonia halotolerans]|uniref:hypothetical protein n=1 Tax=Nesterenkonia halotolerans TaxID=225325 RepID=UPI003EE6EB6B